MGDKEILEIQNLSNEDLLTLYDKVMEHLQYLKESVIDTSEEGGEEESE